MNVLKTAVAVLSLMDGLSYMKLLVANDDTEGRSPLFDGWSLLPFAFLKN